MLSWEDIRQMARNGITFGAHTVTHPALSRIDRTRLQDEIVGSKKTVEARLQLPVRHFAYPFGQPEDYSAESKQLVQETGFESAVTTIWGFNSPDQDRFELKRFCPWETDPAMFALKLDWYRLVGVQPHPNSSTERNAPLWALDNR
jgi:peptidoglycan/xylan/chitin deacetylase (PgdA/CDA1 family)